MKNIKIIYAISFITRSWFWYGIWVLYYLLYTDYAGIGLLESIMIVTSTVTEIPTGALADLFGKKKTISLAMLIISLGSIFMGYAPSIYILSVAIFILTIGSSLLSGTVEALVYDSLRDIGKTKTYNKTIANISSIKNIAIAFSSIVGGYLYTISPGLPFIAVGYISLIGLILSFFLTEPKYDSEKFSWKNYVSQTKEGFNQLFNSDLNKSLVYYLIITGFFVVIGYEMLNDIQLVEYGLNEKELGIAAAIISLIAAAASQVGANIKGIGNNIRIITIISILISITFIISPIVSFLVGAAIISIRNALQTVYENLTSVIINHNIESKYRATTLSTFTMIRNTPYILGAIFIGAIADRWSALNLGAIIGVIMLVTIIAIRPKQINDKMSL